MAQPVGVGRICGIDIRHRVTPVLVCWTGGGVEGRGVGMRWSLLVDAFWGYLEEWCPWRAGEFEGWIHCWMGYINGLYPVAVIVGG